MGFANLLSGGFRRGDTLPEGQWRSEMVIQGMFLNIYTDENEYNQALSDYYEPYESVYKSLTPKNRPSQGYLLFEQMSEAVLKERVARILQFVPKESPFTHCDNNDAVAEKTFGDLILQSVDGILALRSIVDIHYPIMEGRSGHIMSFLEIRENSFWWHPLSTLGGFRGFIAMFFGERGAVSLEEITTYFSDRAWCLHSDSIETFFKGLIALRNISKVYYEYLGGPCISAEIINWSEQPSFMFHIAHDAHHEGTMLLMEKLFHPDPDKSWSREQMIRSLDSYCGGTTAIREFETDN